MPPDDRDHFFELAASHTSYVTTVVDGATYLVRTEDENVGKSLFLKGGRSEMLILRRAIALVQEALGDDALADKSFLDVGANIGTTTVPALRSGPFANAICFEPEPSNVLNLRLNLLLNGLEERAATHAVAVSDSTGTAQFVADTRQSGQGWVALDEARIEQRDLGDVTITVPTTTIDELVDTGVIDPDRVGMLWMDAQSHEGHILAGAGRLLERGVPVVLEWYPRALDRLGDRGKLQDSVAAHYTHFIDLRAKDGEDVAVHDASTLDGFADAFAGPEGRRYTDILIMRLSAEVAARLNGTMRLEHLDAAEPPAPTADGAPARKPAKPAREKPAREKPFATERDELRRAKRALLEGYDIEAEEGSDAAAQLKARKRSAEANAVREAKQALLASAGGADGVRAAKARGSRKRTRPPHE